MMREHRHPRLLYKQAHESEPPIHTYIADVFHVSMTYETGFCRKDMVHGNGCFAQRQDGWNCHVEPYIFVAAKPTNVIA
jgi:hypothetical protein